MSAPLLILLALGAVALVAWLAGPREDVERANRRRQLREERERAVRRRARK